MAAMCYAGKILRVDLSSGKIEKQELEEGIAKRFLGSKGFGAKFLYDELPAKTDPFSPENQIIISTGPLTGTGAFSPKCNMATKSPLTGGWLDCTLGGFFGPELKFAGYDVLIISGKAPDPVYLWINDDMVELRLATELWGKTSHEAEKSIKKDLDDQKIRVTSIGPAGENLVRFACVNGDLYRQAGRGGIGAVWGSKNLKAVAARGSGEVGLADKTNFFKHMQEFNKYLKENSGPFSSEGLMFLVDLINDNGMMPTRNFQESVFEGAKKINAEALLSTIKKRDMACHKCVVGCGNFCEIEESEFGPFEIEGPEYETACLLGANCGVDNLEAIAYLNVLCDSLGIDTISTGGTIAFAMECYQRGILTSKDVDGLDLNWGNYRAMVELIKKIVYREGIGDLFAEGSARAAEKIGKEAPKYAIHVKGLELPGYDPRGAIGMALAYSIADRGGCHLRAWTIYDEVVGEMDRFSPVGKAFLDAKRINRKAIMDCLGMCEVFGLSGQYSTLLGEATGWKVDQYIIDQLPGDFIGDFFIDGEKVGIGERVSNLTRAFNIREGFAKKDDIIPERFFKDAVPEGPVKGHIVPREDFDKMLREFYEVCGWDKNGIPTKEKLLELGLENAVKDLWP